MEKHNDKEAQHTMSQEDADAFWAANLPGAFAKGVAPKRVKLKKRGY